MTDNPVSAEQRVTDETVEKLAQYLHDECEWHEYDFPDYSWPDHADDDGKRGDGYLKVVPRSAADEFREIARRILKYGVAPTAAPANVMPTIEECHTMATKVGLRFVPYNELDRLRKMEAASESTYKHWRDRALKAEAAPASTGVEVEKLTWRKYRDCDAEAIGLFGVLYTAFADGRWRVNRLGNIHHGGKDLEAAKAAAQADYETRILSALSPVGVSASAEPVAEAPALWVSPTDLRAWERSKAGEIWAWPENVEGQCIPLYRQPQPPVVDPARRYAMVFDGEEGWGMYPDPTGEYVKFEDTVTVPDRMASAAPPTVGEREKAPEEMWQPIESAPKDGTDILLGSGVQSFNGSAVPARVTIGRWPLDEECRTQIGDCGGECRCPEYEYHDPYWMSWDGGFTTENPCTHWMPLPAPPALSRSEPENGGRDGE